MQNNNNNNQGQQNGDGKQDGDGNSQNAANYQAEMKTIEEKIVNKVTGEVTVKKYSMGKLLGTGGFARCYEVICQETKTVFAGKIIPKKTLTKSRQRVKLISEIKIHKSLHHKNIVQFEHVFEDHENVYILLELCPYQTLNELIKRRRRITEYEAQVYIMQMVNGLKYLQANKIIHRDLKLGNVFIGDNMQLKIGDFGLATKLDFDGERKKTICGTPNYIAPEILESKDGHSYEVDIWSLGVIIYTFLIGKPPFETKEVRTTYKRIKSNNYSFPDSIQISDNAKSMITSILNLDPAQRPKVGDLLQHPFLSGIGQNPENLPISTLVVPYHKSKKNKENNKLSSTTLDPLNQRMNSMTLTSSQLNNTNGAGTARGNSNIVLTSDLTEKGVLRMQPAANTFRREEIQNNPANPVVTAASEIWVRQWVDYSNKHGMGYALNNGTVGIFFNDLSKMIIDPAGTVIEYYESVPDQKLDKFSSFPADNYPTELKGKITLLQHFRAYLDQDAQTSNSQNTARNRNPQATQQPPIWNIDAGTGNKTLFYVKKWQKRKQAILFRLSNKIVQVDFSDTTEIILNSHTKMVTYRNKLGVRSNYPLSQNLNNQNDAEMSKRLKFTKLILSEMINNNINNAQAAAQNHNQQPQLKQAQQPQSYQHYPQQQQQQQQQQLSQQQGGQVLASNPLGTLNQLSSQRSSNNRLYS